MHAIEDDCGLLCGENLPLVIITRGKMGADVDWCAASATLRPKRRGSRTSIKAVAGKEYLMAKEAKEKPQPAAKFRLG